MVTNKPNAWGPTLSAKPAGPQVGGFVTGFNAATDANASAFEFRFVTVRNSGHMTPAYAPQKTLHTVYRALVAQKPLSPPLPEAFSTANQVGAIAL